MFWQLSPEGAAHAAAERKFDVLERARWTADLTVVQGPRRWRIEQRHGPDCVESCLGVSSMASAPLGALAPLFRRSSPDPSSNGDRFRIVSWFHRRRVSRSRLFYLAVEIMV